MDSPSPQHNRIERILHEIFEVGILLKAINGTWETVTGFLVVALPMHAWRSVGAWLLRRELLEHPRDSLVTWVIHAFQLPIGAMRFAGLYILFHGVLNLFLAVQLYRERRWAYVFAMVASVIFMAYQVHRIFLYHSHVLMVLTVIDVFFFWLTWHEYRQLSSNL